MGNHHFQWVSPLFQWQFSIAMLNYQRAFENATIKRRQHDTPSPESLQVFDITSGGKHHPRMIPNVGLSLSSLGPHKSMSDLSAGRLRVGRVMIDSSTWDESAALLRW